MSRFAQLLIIGVVAGAASMASRADDCKFTAERDAKIDAAGAKSVEITARAGSLEIEGSKDAARVEAHGRACASDQKSLDEIRIDTRREGEVLYVDVRMPEMKGKWLDDDDDRYARLDVRITLPQKLAVTALDSSGEARVRNVASLNMTDSSGELRISDVAGDVTVRDSSGELSIRNVEGSVKLNDSSGDVDIAEVGRDVNVEVDSSGGLEIRQVKGNVRIEQDSSGDIRIDNVTGDVRIDSDSSGGVDVARVGGAFSLGMKGSGDVQFADIKGAVSVPRR